MRHFLQAGFRTAIVGLLVSGCTISGGLQSARPGADQKPGVILISDFNFAPDVVAIDRAYTARLERKIGSFPAHQRSERTAERVNDEIVATIIAALRQAGLEAQTGGPETLTLDQSAFVLSGALRPSEPVTAKNKNNFGFGSGRGHVVAEMNGFLFSAGGKRQILNFNIESSAAKSEAVLSPKAAAARNAALAEIVAAGGRPNERLSADVEVPARRLGRAIADRVIAFAKEEGWLTPPAAPEPKTADPPPNGNQDIQSETAPEVSAERPAT
ncbi:MAG TPA: hypothetical protein VH558_07705 [Pseudolabrys sp.]|jgi:hypothetical protein